MIGHGVPGLNIQQSYDFPAHPVQVFAALTGGFDQWWPRTWRQTGPQGTLSLMPIIGAALLEVGPDDAQAIWGWIDGIKPPWHLYLLGRFGVDGVVAGRVHFDLEAVDSGCRLSVLHQAIGPVPEDRGGSLRRAWRAALDDDLRQFLIATGD